MAYHGNASCGEELLTWKKVSSHMLVLPEPSRKNVARYERRGLISLRALLGVFDIYWECVHRVTRSMVDKVDLVKLPSRGCGARKQRMDELIKKARYDRDTERVLELRMMCHIFQAEEIIDLYGGLMHYIIGGIPERNEKFYDWLKRMHGLKKFKYKTGRNGWKYTKRVSEF